MKKIYMTMVAMLCGVAASAQTFSSEDITAVADGKTVTYLVLNFEEAAAAATQAGASVTFPEALFIPTGEKQTVEYLGDQYEVDVVKGMSIAQYYNEDDEEYVDDIEYPKTKSGHDIKLFTGHPLYPNIYSIAVGSVKNNVTFKTSTNVLAKIGLVFDPAVPNGEYEVTLKPYYAVGDESPETDPDPITIKLTVTGGTGINGINALDSKAPVYNLAGQRVSNAQKGVFIQNGKKVAVK
jgi:hypothetical protein